MKNNKKNIDNQENNNEKTLLNIEKNIEYKIKKINISNDDVVNLLRNLGIYNNEKVIVLKTNYGNKSMLVNVSGINFALDKKVCEGIIVE